MALVATLATAAAACPAAQPATRQIRIPMTCKGYAIDAEVAASEHAISLGLMFRREMGEDAGMLFVFGAAGLYGMWMRNTYIPLSVAFLDSGGRIVNIEQMEPFDESTIHRAAEPASYALEMNWGWFRRHGVRPGDVCTFSLP